MLYALLKPLMKTALRLYFRRIVLSGMEQIDNGRPTIMLANHTGSFLDAMMVACFVRRRIHFFTRGDVFKHRWADTILRSLGMLPVYRMRDGRDMLQLNDSSNEEALKILAGGGAVLIFAEGESNIAKMLKPLKKGPFRLAVAAAAALGEAPLLVPLGINYINQLKPFGDAFLNAAAPLGVPAFLPGTDAAAAKAATDMMRLTALALRPLAWHMEHEAGIPVGDALLNLLKDIKPGYSFGETQQVLRQLNSEDVAVRGAIRADWEEYKLWQRQHPVSDAQYSPPPRGIEWIILIAGFPIAAAGVCSHIIPVLIAKSIADKKVREPDFRAPVFLSGAVLCVGLWYVLWMMQGIVGRKPLRAPFLLAAAAASGVFYLNVYRPVLRKATGIFTRAIYRSYNPSYALVDKLHRSLIHFVKKALGEK